MTISKQLQGIHQGLGVLMWFFGGIFYHVIFILFFQLFKNGSVLHQTFGIKSKLHTAILHITELGNGHHMSQSCFNPLYTLNIQNVNASQLSDDVYHFYVASTIDHLSPHKDPPSVSSCLANPPHNRILKMSSKFSSLKQNLNFINSDRQKHGQDWLIVSFKFDQSLPNFMKVKVFTVS